MLQNKYFPCIIWIIPCQKGQLMGCTAPEELYLALCFVPSVGPGRRVSLCMCVMNNDRAGKWLMNESSLHLSDRALVWLVSHETAALETALPSSIAPLIGHLTWVTWLHIRELSAETFNPPQKNPEKEIITTKRAAHEGTAMIDWNQRINTFMHIILQH